MTNAIAGRKPEKFLRLKSVDDFIDGFELIVSHDITGR